MKDDFFLRTEGITIQLFLYLFKTRLTFSNFVCLTCYFVWKKNYVQINDFLKIMKFYEIVGNKFHSGECICYKLVYRFIWGLRAQSSDINYVVHTIISIKGCYISF